MTDAELLAAIAHLCRRYAHSGTNMAAHFLASKIAKQIEEHEARRESEPAAEVRAIKEAV